MLKKSQKHFTRRDAVTRGPKRLDFFLWIWKNKDEEKRKTDKCEFKQEEDWKYISAMLKIEGMPKAMRKRLKKMVRKRNIKLRNYCMFETTQED